MARTMKKFSAGGAQGRYDRRMADIEKDYAKAMTRKTGKAAEVAEAKRQQRIADAKDDLAKRTGADRSATRAAEKLAESNLTKTRKYGAPKAVTTEASVSQPKITDTLGALTAPKSGLATSTKKVEVKKAADKPKPSAADIKRDKFFQDSLKKTNFKTAARMAEAPIAPSKFDKAAFEALKTKAGTAPSAPKTTSKRYETPAEAKARVARLTGSAKRRENLADMFGLGSVDSAKSRAKLLATREAEKARNAARAKGNKPLVSGSDTGAFFTYGKAAAEKNASNKAKGGTVKKETTMKYARGGVTPANKTPKTPKTGTGQPARKPMLKEPITGGANTVPLTPERKEFLKELAKRSGGRGYAAGGVTKEMPSSKAMGSLGMAKGGKAKAKPAAKAKGKPFAATKFGAALMKKSADTKGRAMPKFAKGGSIDGCAVRGKTKAKRVTMKKGGSC